MKNFTHDGAGNPHDPGCRIQLLKNAQQWFLTVPRGEEHRVHEALAGLVTASDGELDWFDAAVICLELETRRVR